MLVVLLCVEVIWQGVPDHRAVHSECLVASGHGGQWIADVVAPASVAVMQV